MKFDAQRGFLMLFLAASLAYHLARVYLTATALLDPAAYPGSPFHLKAHSPEVAKIDDEARGAGLRVGDRVLQAEDRNLRGDGDLELALVAAAPAGRLRIQVERPAGPVTLDLPLPANSPPKTGGEIAFDLVLEVVLPLLFLGTGFTVVWFKPDDKAAWILLCMMETFSNLANAQSVELGRLGPWIGAMAAVWLSLFASSWTLTMLSFALVFPEPLPLDRRKPWLKWLVLLPLLAFSVMIAGSNLSMADYSWGERFGVVTERIGQAYLLLIYLAMSLFFWTLGYKLGNTKSPDGVRRLRILMTGAAVAMAPSGLIATVAVLTGTPYGLVVPEALRFLAGLIMLIFPATLAYVVIVHKAMGLGMVIRQSLQYALAQRAVRTIQIGMVVVVGFGLLEILSDPQKRQVDRLRSMALAALVIVFFQKGALRFRTWIDKRFFREAVDAERILADLGEHVRTIADRRDLLETVSRTIGEALHIPKVAAFVRVELGFVPSFAIGYGGEALPLEFGNAGVLTCGLAALQKPQTVYLDDKRSWVRRENIPEADASKLRDLQSEVLIPLRTKAAVEGFLSLGPKSSEAAYSPSDLHLLQSVAYQTALALDNSRLVEQVASEVAKRERMTREIEIAREVQFTLLPQQLPEIIGLDFGGHCRPAAGVGGDYYDFIPLEGERAIGLAIGDIAGKGIPAALLMAGLQAALRGQALSGSRDLARLMANINKLIFESSPANRYATFFYGEYRDGVFSYVNAGHNAPMVLRQKGQVERLEQGGPVIGLMSDAAFVEGTVELGPGDVFLGYTDGISECMNPRDEEWGEENLLEVLAKERNLEATTLALRVLAAADAFASGAKQHDDMTLIVMKVLKRKPQ